MPPEGVGVLIAITLIGGFACLYPVVRALAERIRGRADTGMRDELQNVREDVAQDAQQTHQEIAELSERVDFLERSIANQRGAERLPPAR